MGHSTPQEESFFSKKLFLKKSKRNQKITSKKNNIMRLQSNQTFSLLKSLSNEEIKFLTTEIKEELSSNIKKERKRIFTSAQLWDIQRRRKNLSIQKNYL